MTNWLILLGFCGIAAEVGWVGRRIIVRLDWQHDTIVPWINSLNTKLGLPK